MLARDGHFFHQPAFLFPSVLDTTGCGDSYHGAFLFGLLRGLPLEKTAALASAVAALNSQALGGRGGIPTYAQAAAFLAEFKQDACVGWRAGVRISEFRAFRAPGKPHGGGGCRTAKM